MSFFIKFGSNIYNVKVALKFNRVGSGALFQQTYHMCWTFVSQRFCISCVSISAISQHKISWCKPSQTRAIQTQPSFPSYFPTVASTARPFVVCWGVPQMDTLFSVWFWCFALLDMWQDSFILILESFDCNEMNEQFTGPSRLPPRCPSVCWQHGHQRNRSEVPVALGLCVLPATTGCPTGTPPCLHGAPVRNVSLRSLR